MNSSGPMRLLRHLAICASLVGVAAVDVVSAQAAELAGSWVGSGSMALSTGTKERASCRARYSKIGKSSYAMSASCATASARVDQTATLRQTGANSFAGSFYNAQYNTRGAISVVVSGSTQNISISGEAGRGFFKLYRR